MNQNDMLPEKPRPAAAPENRAPRGFGARRRRWPLVSVRCVPRPKSLCRPLATDDYALQSMPDASPAKWHIAHTSWFFEEFVLQAAIDGYRCFDPAFRFLFNSYYESVGPRHARPERGLLSRPTIEQVWAYRSHVDEEMEELLATNALSPEQMQIVIIGLHHEQQHQELFLTDIKHLFSRNPLRPALRDDACAGARSARRTARRSSSSRAVSRRSATPATGFCFDNELGRHRVFLEPYRLANRLATNGEYLQFIREGGYEKPEFWLSDGWATVQREQWRRPLYWADSLDHEFTLLGERDLDLNAPVSPPELFRGRRFRPLGRRRACPPSSSGRTSLAASACKAISSKTEPGIPSPRAPRATRRAHSCCSSSGTCGNGRRPRMHPIRGFSR